MLKPIQLGWGVSFQLGADSQRTLTHLEAVASEYNARLAKFDSDSAQLAGIADENFSAKHVAQGDRLRGQKLELLKDAISFHRALDAFLNGVRQVDVHEARDAAWQRLQAVKSDVQQKLQDVGFSPDAAAKITGGHPAVMAANAEHDSISDGSALAAMKVNDAALDRCRQLLANFRAKLVAI